MVDFIKEIGQTAPNIQSPPIQIDNPNADVKIGSRRGKLTTL
jgi:hypothetical protein